MPTRITNIDASQCQTLTNGGLIDAFGMASPRDIEFTVFVQQVRAIYPAMSLDDITWLYYGQCHAYIVATPTPTATRFPTITNTPTWRITPDPSDPLFTICHWQPSTGTYLSLETNPSYILGEGQLMTGNDIIPPFTYGGVEYQHNWNAYGKDVLYYGCQTLPEPPIRFCYWFEVGEYANVTTSVYTVLDGFSGQGHEQNIIPPSRTMNELHPPQNWDATGQAIWENGCVVPDETTPPPTNTPMPTPTPTTTPLPATNGTQIRICHAQPQGYGYYLYVPEVLGANGIRNGHLRSHDNDIVPPFMLNGTRYSQNWTTEGQAIWNNGCSAPPF